MLREFWEEWVSRIRADRGGTDEMEEVKADVFRAGLEVGPSGEIEVAPEFVDQLHPERNVTQHFAVKGVKLVEAGFGVGVFPEFSGVVEEDTDEDEVDVELGIDGADGLGGAHHLSDVLDEAATASVVVFSGGRSSAKTSAELGEVDVGERF